MASPYQFLFYNFISGNPYRYINENILNFREPKRNSCVSHPIATLQPIGVKKRNSETNN